MSRSHEAIFADILDTKAFATCLGYERTRRGASGLMFDHDSPAAAEFWRHRAALLARRINFHHGLARVVPKLFVLLVVVAGFDLARREAGGSIRWTGGLCALGLAAVLGWAWWQARAHFCSAQNGLVRLETILGLHNQLSAAQAGVGRWPRPPAEIDDGYSVNWRAVLVPLVAGSLFLVCAHLVPLGRLKLTGSAASITEPPEIAQVQTWINALKADNLVQPDKLQEMQAALDKLRKRPAQDWYTQGDLEAANSLKELAEQSMNSLSRDMDKADQAVQAMKDKLGSPDGAAALQPMQDQLRAAGQNLASGNLPLNQEMVAAMKNAEMASDKKLSAAQLAALHDRLKKGELAAQTAAKSSAGFSAEMEKAMAEADAHGGGLMRRHGKPGSGGPGGGGPPAPLELQQREATTPDGKLTAVNNDDMSRASLGQTIKISASAHHVDPSTYTGSQQAGAAQTTGNGGEAVWRSTYDPQEADTLDRYFK